jgi:hypothetical protein
MYHNRCALSNPNFKPESRINLEMCKYVNIEIFFELNTTMFWKY